MAMRACRECGQEVSTDAATCPRCGIPKPSPATAYLVAKKVVSRSLLVLGVLFLAGTIGVVVQLRNTPVSDSSATPTQPVSATISSHDDVPQGSNTLPTASPTGGAPSSPTALGDSICREWQSLGNHSTDFAQRCQFRTSPSGGAYTLTFTGDYGDDWLAVAEAMVEQLEIIDARYLPRSTLISVSFPDQETAVEGRHIFFTVPMTSVSNCRQSNSAAIDQRLCTIGAMAQAMRKGRHADRVGLHAIIR